MNIVVSAFITAINKNDKSIQNYIDLGDKLLSADITNLKIIFIERHIYTTYFATIDNVYIFKYEHKEFEFIIDKNIIFVFFEKTDIYLYNYSDVITNFNIITDNPGKDTLEYMFIQCHKTEWVKMAITLITNLNLKNDIFQYIWIDFGIYHQFPTSEVFLSSFESLKRVNPSNTKVRIASCINPANPYHSDIYKYVAWYFAGSVFGGLPETLLRFAELMKTECINIIKERKHLMWEVNIWYLIFSKHPELFDPYLCNHNPSIIMNYAR